MHRYVASSNNTIKLTIYSTFANVVCRTGVKSQMRQNKDDFVYVPHYDDVWLLSTTLVQYQLSRFIYDNKFAQSTLF